MGLRGDLEGRQVTVDLRSSFACGDNSNSNDGSLMKYYEGERVSRWFVCTQRAIMLLGAAGGESFLSGVVTVV